MSRFVVSATDIVTGGGMTGAAGVNVTRAVGADGGTRLIWGREEGVGVIAGVWEIGGFSPCRSSFLSSSVAMRDLIRAILC